MDSKTAIKQLNELSKHGRKMRLAAEQWPSDFQTLISIILSARSLDEITIKYATILFERFPDAEELSKAKIKDVEKIIFPINFYQNKSKYIINCAKELVEKYNGKVPHDFEKLIELSGAGRKTANVFLAERGGANIGVDTHVNYCSRYLGWTKAKETQPDKIEEDLQKLFPKNYWNKLNRTLVRFGKSHTSRTEKNKLLDEVKKLK
jgi:endonuclease III